MTPPRGQPVAMRGQAALLALVLLLPLAAGLPSLVRTLSPASAPFNGLQLALADFRGDGHLEVVAQSDDGNVYVMDPATGATLATFAPGNAGCTSSCYSFEGVSGPINAPVVADVDGNGRLDVIVADTAAVVARFEVDPARSTSTSLAFDKIWEHQYNQYQSFTTMDATPVVGDLLGNGQLDVVVATEETGVFAVRPDGSTLWQQPLPSGHASPSIRDIDGDGRVEVVVPNDDGRIFVLDGATGATKWTFDASQYVWPASVPAAATLTDITGDGKPDVIFALDSWGHLLWRAQPSWAAPLTHTRPIAVDVSGRTSIVWGDWNTIGHKPGDFETVGPGHVALFDAATGREVWHRDLDAYATQSNLDLVVADAMGDGTQQVLAAGTSNGQTGVWVFDLASGATRAFLATPAPTRSFAATADGLLGDGRFDLALADGNGQLQVFSGPRGAEAAFPGWGAIHVPHETVPLAGTGTPSGAGGSTFPATFGPKGNDWWIETSVTSTHEIASVTATVGSGAPVALPKDSWGTWAKSLYAPSGTPVTLTATDSSGATASACYAWLTFAPCSSTAGSGSGGGSGGSSFSAQFQPLNGNDWWIQVHVTSTAPLSGVWASIDGGAWQPLKLQWWGDWAASDHAPAGSQVRFQATSATGAQATSGSFTWPQ
jgi:outer membrane protein assembly factor BamB